jgi:hypothetical protein
MEEIKNEESEMIMCINRKSNEMTELVIKSGVYTYEMINAILLILNKLFETSKTDVSLDENLDAKINAIKAEYKLRFLNVGVIDGEENESIEED